MKAVDAANIVVSQGITGPAALLVLAIGKLESSWGEGWKGPGEGSNNWGAITAGKTWKGETFETEDSMYNEKTGKVDVYKAQFRKYPSPGAGAHDLYQLLATTRHKGALDAVAKGDWLGASTSLRESSYYLGVKTKQKAIVDHYNRMRQIINGFPDEVFTILGTEKPELPPASSGAMGIILGAIVMVSGYLVFRR